MKIKYPPDLLKKIKDAINLVEVIGEHVVLRKAGSNYVGLCPFHSERSPSFGVSESKQLYHCHGCKKGGDLVNFVMEMHGISFPEAIEELAERARVALPKDLKSPGSSADDPEVERQRAAKRQKLATAYKLNRFVAAFYHQMLGQLAPAEQYFRKRGVHGELSRSFYVGAAPPGWDALASHLAAKKAPLPLASELGLIRPSPATAKRVPGGIGYFDLFRNRAMFPILDTRGKVAGFGGRKLPPSAGESSQEPSEKGMDPKYLNSPESLLFQKSKLVFGLYQAQKHIREKDEVILVEGYFDVLALHAGGFQNVVATCGTALTAEHLQMLRRFASRLVVLFDSDKAGIMATEKAMELGLDHGLILHGARLPADLDPDELLFDQESGTPQPAGVEEMKAVLGAAQPLLDLRIEEAIEAARNGPEARTQALKQVGAWLGRFKDPVGKEVRIQGIAEKMGNSRDLLKLAMTNSGGERPRQNPPRPAAHVTPVKPKPTRLTPSERILLAGIARQGQYLDLLRQLGSNLPPNQSIAALFEHAPARELIEKWVVEGGLLGPTPAPLERVLEPDLDGQVRSVLTEATLSPEEDSQKAGFQAALDRALLKAWARFSQQIKIAIGHAEASKDAGLQSRLMKEYLDVQRKMKEFNSFYDEA